MLLPSSELLNWIKVEQVVKKDFLSRLKLFEKAVEANNRTSEKGCNRRAEITRLVC